MKLGTILHNPGAGDEEHEAEDLIELLEKNGFESKYVSIREPAWKGFPFETDFLVVAGGDGTVRKVIKALLDRKMIAKTWPIALLPLGTANNIAKTLNIEGESEAIVAAWRKKQAKRYDVGCIYYGKKSNFFLESFGYGLFPYLMREIKKRYNGYFETPEAKINTALTLLHELTFSYEPRQCTLFIDDIDYSGKFLLAEVMNTQSIGPNLLLAPEADPGDGLLDVVVVPEQDREKFTRYISERIEGRNEQYDFNTIRGRNIKVSWQGTHVHLDDETIRFSANQEVQIETKKEMLEFIVT